MNLRKKLIGITISLSFLFISCNDLLSENEVVPEIISLVLVEKDLPMSFYADGKTVISFEAAVSPNVSNSFRNIKFTSLKGKIIGASADKSRTVEINKLGKANIDWQVPDSAGVFFINAKISSKDTTFSEEYKIEIKEIDKNLDFKINKPNKPLNADNKSTLMLNVQINPELPEKYKTVIFKTTQGSFIGTDDAQTREIKVDENGKAQLYWKAGTEAGKLYFSAEIKAIANSKVEEEIELKALKPYYVMSIENKENILADGSSIIKIRIDSAVNITNNKIKLSHSAGTLIEEAGSPFENGVLTLVSGKGVAYLKVGNTVEDYFIKTETENKDFFSNSSFRPKRAFAEQLFVESELDSNNDYAISVFLSRSDGRVSIGTPVSFEAYQMIDEEKLTTGKFEGLKEAFSDVEENVNVKFKIDESEIDSTIPILIKVSSQLNSMVSDLLVTTIEI